MVEIGEKCQKDAGEVDGDDDWEGRGVKRI